MLRTIAIACSLVLAGCYQWVPVHDAASLRNDRIRVDRGDGTTETLEHAYGCDPTTIVDAERCDCVNCRRIDITRQKVTVRHEDKEASAATFIGALGGIAFAVVIAALVINYRTASWVGPW
jgi:hypothetical protein